MEASALAQLEAMLESLPDDEEVESPKPAVKISDGEFEFDVDNTVAPNVNLGRLIYLIVHHKIRLPWAISRILPFGSHLQNLHEGLGAVGDVDELSPLYNLGIPYGEGSIKEAVLIILRMVEPHMSTYNTTIAQRLAIYQELIAMNVDEIVHMEFEELDLVKASEETIKYWDTGFSPFDEIMGGRGRKFGFYNGLFVVMGYPGVGKTSILLTFMESLVSQGVPVTYYENEIPGKMMRPKIAPMIKRTPAMAEIGRVTCGPWTSQRIVADQQADPNEDRVIIWDSPDSSPEGQGGDNRRHDLTDAYINMVRIKPIVKAIFVASQPKNLGMDHQLTMGDGAEAWAKAWWADAMLSINALNDRGSILSQVMKNRFGPNYRSISYIYNHVDLTWDPMAVDEDWELDRTW